MSTIDQPTPERTTTVNDNYTPDWDGALAVKDCDGSVWTRAIDGYHLPGSARSAAYIEERWGPITVVTPAPEATTPEPSVTATKPEPKVTWLKGRDQAPIREAWKPGRRAQVVTEGGGLTTTRDGEIDSHGFGHISLEEWLDYVSITSITVWLPEAPEVPKWAQDYDIPGDGRALVSDDGRVWRPVVANAAHIEKWRWKGNPATEAATTEELQAMGARLLIDPDGKAAL